MTLILIQAIYVIINAIIGVYDFSFFRIPNALLASLLVLYAVTAPFIMSFDTIISSSVVCLITLTVCFVLFVTKMIGGGDAKYLTVISLWAGVSGVLPLLLFVTLIGGLLAIVYLVFRDHVQRLSDWVWLKIQKVEETNTAMQYVWAGSGTGSEKGKRENISTKLIPYGIAIALAAIIMMIYNPPRGI